MRVVLSDLTLTENTNSFVIGSYQGKEFFWERGAFDVRIGNQLVSIEHSEAKAARKAILKAFRK